MPALANTQPSSLDAARVEAIRRLNDDLRVHGRGGRIVVTAGVRSLPPATLPLVFRAMTTFDAFTAENDPYGEHDFGSLEVDGQTVFWKIDAYDRSLTAHSPNATDPAVTTRVLTIMRADEY